MPKVEKASHTSKPAKVATLDAAGRKAIAAAIVAQAGDGKRFPDLQSGNCGVHGYVVDAARAQVVLDLAQRGATFDPSREVVVGLVETEDESSARVLIADVHTHALREAGDLNFFNVEMQPKSGEAVEPFHALWLLFHGVPELPLPHGDDWTIDAYKTDGEPTKLPALKIPKPLAPVKEAWVSDDGRDYLAGKMAQHAGTKFPALDAGKRGTHFYEVAGDAARTLTDLSGGWYDPKTDVCVVALQTNDALTMQVTLMARADVGKPQIGADRLDPIELGAYGVSLLAGAKELPVPGRVEGFSLRELDGRSEKAARKAVGGEVPSTKKGKADPTKSPLATRLSARKAE